MLVLDEPTAGLDSGSEQRMVDTLRTLSADRTLLLVTHKTALLDLVDRLIVLDQGRIVADGPKNNVLGALRERSAG